MKSTKNYIRADLSTLTAMIAHSQIVVMLGAARCLPAGFDERDIAILEWIKFEAAAFKRSYLC
jgi:hypothetical protein